MEKLTTHRIHIEVDADLNLIYLDVDGVSIVLPELDATIIIEGLQGAVSKLDQDQPFLWQIQ